MRNESIEIFKSNEFGGIRTTTDEAGKPWFCLGDLCKALDLNPSKAAQRLAKDVLLKYPLETRGGIQMVNFVDEDGLYDIVLDSRKPEARRFRKWITSEVLPAIRQRGGYIVTHTNEADEEVLARAVLIANEAIRRKNKELETLRPKADYADLVLDSVSCLTTSQIAKELNMSAYRLNRRLQELGVQFFQSGQWMLYIDYARKGYARNRTHGYYNSDGNYCTSTYLVWTEKGREFLHRIINH